MNVRLCSGCGLYYICSYRPSDAVLVLSYLLDVSGGAFIMQGLTVASQGSVPHQDLAVAIAIQILWSTVSGAIGSAIASSIWTHTLPQRLAANLGEVLDQESIDAAYGSILVARVTEPRDLVRKCECQRGLADRSVLRDRAQAVPGDPDHVVPAAPCSLFHVRLRVG